MLKILLISTTLLLAGTGGYHYACTVKDLCGKTSTEKSQKLPSNAPTDIVNDLKEGETKEIDMNLEKQDKWTEENIKAFESKANQ